MTTLEEVADAIVRGAAGLIHRRFATLEKRLAERERAVDHRLQRELDHRREREAKLRKIRRDV